MSRDLNQVIIIGRLVKDPEIKYTANGTPVTKFSIANNISYMQNNNLVEYANYFDINVWGNQAVSCEKYLKKGSMVAINGSLRQQRWDDKTTGQKRSKIEITANSVQFLSGQGGGQPNKQSSFGEKKNFPANNQTAATQSEGIIEDPWNDGANAGGFDEAFTPGTESDDDIPF
jgi:single-strand DNA-binding protein